MSEKMTRLEIKRFSGQESRTEEYLGREHKTPRRLTRAERDALAMLALRILEAFSTSRSRRYGYSLISFFADADCDSLRTNAATYLRELPKDPYSWSEDELASARKKIAGELRQLNAKTPRDALQKRLDWVAEEAGLNDLDRQVLGVLVRAQTIAPYGWLLTYLSPNHHHPEDVHLISLMGAAGCTRRAIESRLTPLAPLIANGLVQDIADHEFVATYFAMRLARLRTTRPNVTKQAFREGLELARAEPIRFYSADPDDLVAI